MTTQSSDNIPVFKLQLTQATAPKTYTFKIELFKDGGLHDLIYRDDQDPRDAAKAWLESQGQNASSNVELAVALIDLIERETGGRVSRKHNFAADSKDRVPPLEQAAGVPKRTPTYGERIKGLEKEVKGLKREVARLKMA